MDKELFKKLMQSAKEVREHLENERIMNDGLQLATAILEIRIDILRSKRNELAGTSAALEYGMAVRELENAKHSIEAQMEND